MNSKSATRLAASLSLATGLGLAMVAPASADGGGGVDRQGSCSMQSNWELKASQDGDGKDGGHHRKIEVEFRIETNHGGQLWTWTISDNGTVQAQGQNRTEQGNQRVDVRRNIANQQGPDQISLAAQNTVTGETCDGTVTLHGQHHH